MKLPVAIICAIVCAASVTVQGAQDRCSGKSEQDCIKDPGCQETYGNPRRANGDDFHTSNAPLKWDYTGCYEPKPMTFPEPMDFFGLDDPSKQGGQQ